tara:strand:+ start:3326 stop:3607 length:282 start_codon:yes stop_codon:yes gene_type:complete
MLIQSITKYPYKGEEYNSLKEVKEEIHNTIGLEILDKISKTCPLQKHADYQKLLDLLCSREVRETLAACLTVNVKIEPEHWEDETEMINILDV